MIRLPGRCIVCGTSVVWNGKSWTTGRQGGHKHVCPTDRPTCGAWMPQVKERCARRPLHSYEHRSEYALANARRVA